MTSSPLVSVCIPTYRGAEHIAETIKSVLAQTLGDFELVVIDDNSPDGTAEIVAAFADPRIRLLRNATNLGPEGNWNRCLGEARGTYFKLLPHDDLLHPECLRRQVDVLESDVEGEIALVFCARTMVNASGRPQIVRRYPGRSEGRISSRSIIADCVRRGTNLMGEPAAVLMRRDRAIRVGQFNAAFPYVVDLEYWFRLLLHGDGWYLDSPLVSFRISRGQWSVVIGQGQSKDFLSLVKHISLLPVYTVSRFDRIAAHGMARLNNFLRLIYYRLVLK